MKRLLPILLLSATAYGQPTCGTSMHAVPTGDYYSCVPNTIADQRILGNTGGTTAMPYALTPAQVATMLGPDATKDTVTAVTSLPTAALATVGRVYRWTSALVANLCPLSDGGVAGTAVAFCVTVDGSTWLPVDLSAAASLGSESLAQGDFATHTKWSVSGDWAFGTGNVVFTKSAGSGSLTQTSGNMTISGTGSVVYRLQYDLSSISPGDLACYITTAFASATTSLTLGTANAAYFTAAGSPGNFVIGCSGTSGTATLDNLSLKQVTQGTLTTGGLKATGLYGTASRPACIGADGTISAGTNTAGTLTCP